MHSDVLLLKHKNPNRSQQAPPGWFSQVSWFFPASLAWKHLPAVRKAPPSKTTNPAPLFPSRWPRTSYVCLNSLSVRPCNITQGENTLHKLFKQESTIAASLCTRTMVAINARPACSVPRGRVCWKEPLQAGTAAESLRKPNLNHFSPETNAQIWKSSCLAEIREEPSP